MLFIQLSILTRTEEEIKAVGDCITSEICPDDQSSQKYMNLVTKRLLTHPFVLSVVAVIHFKDSYDRFLRHSVVLSFPHGEHVVNTR